MVEADADPAKLPTPDLMEELHLSPDSMRETNCDFTVQDFHFYGLVLCVASDSHRFAFDVPLGNAAMGFPMGETTTEKVYLEIGDSPASMATAMFIDC